MASADTAARCGCSTQCSPGPSPMVGLDQTKVKRNSRHLVQSRLRQQVNVTSHAAKLFLYCQNENQYTKAELVGISVCLPAVGSVK